MRHYWRDASIYTYRFLYSRIKLWVVNKVSHLRKSSLASEQVMRLSRDTSSFSKPTYLYFLRTFTDSVSLFITVHLLRYAMVTGFLHVMQWNSYVCIPCEYFWGHLSKPLSHHKSEIHKGLALTTFPFVHAFRQKMAIREVSPHLQRSANDNWLKTQQKEYLQVIWLWDTSRPTYEHIRQHKVL